MLSICRTAICLLRSRQQFVQNFFPKVKIVVVEKRK